VNNISIFCEQKICVGESGETEKKPSDTIVFGKMKKDNFLATFNYLLPNKQNHVLL
jgi:hypothetical protein